MTVSTTTRIHERVAGADWAAVAAELDEHGCAQTPGLLTAAECRRIAALYTDDERFRTTVDMARHRFGSGEYRSHSAIGPDRTGRHRSCCATGRATGTRCTATSSARCSSRSRS
ncbi:hypothetical protein [Streptomyces sp. NBC_01619]|uniref:hypothetical protein n=1 Tax=Streptomyces sp. NBC_01619 TaxID=2975901 RepID=UPI002B1CD90F|nr:hypothetical protein [Streptomyces sp. NBC_01619]